MLIESENGESFLASKVPEVTALFWLVKVMGTTVGETSADFLARELNLGLPTTTITMGAFLAMAFTMQIHAKEYTPWKYWLTVILVSVVGTLITDNMTDNLRIPLGYSTIAFSLMLLFTFISWHASEGTLSIHSIHTRRRECFYWLTILFSFALGTAGGDLMSEQVNLGYAISGLVFASVIGFVAFAFYFFKLNSIWSFWIAYILTRPLGASVGDLLIQPVNASGIGYGSQGGFGLGLGTVNFIFFIGIVFTVTVMEIRKRTAFAVSSVESGREGE